MPLDMTLDTPVLDPHIHLWDPRITPRKVSPAVKLFGWNRGLMESVVRAAIPAPTVNFVGKPDHVLSPYLPGVWRRDTGAYDVRGFVHVEADWQGKRLEDETVWLEDTCGHDLRGLVGHAHLESASLDALLDAHAAASPRFVGVRDIVAADEDRAVMDFTKPGQLENEAWRRGYARLGERGLTFDAWCYGPQLPALDAMVAAVPGTKTVLCHFGSPLGIGGPVGQHGATDAARAETVARWRDDLARLAAHDQVHLKLSGLAMPVSGFAWHEQDAPPTVDEVVDRLGPFVTHALEVFGPSRCMAASNFPMDKVSWPWTHWFDALTQLTAGLTPEDRRRVFHDTAHSFYGLEARPA